MNASNIGGVSTGAAAKVDTSLVPTDGQRQASANRSVETLPISEASVKLDSVSLHEQPEKTQEPEGKTETLLPMTDSNTHLRFEFDKESKELHVLVIDSVTNEVLRMVPTPKSIGQGLLLEYRA